MDRSPLLQALLDLLFPPRCVVAGCGRAGAWLCRPCLARVPALPAPRCPRCAEPGRRPGPCAACRHEPPPFALVGAAGLYAPPLRDAIRALKYRPAAPLAEVLGRLAAQAYREALAGQSQACPRDLCVVPVPAHRRRVGRRGFDHAAALARVVAGAIDRPLSPDILIRHRATHPQAGLNPAERRANLADAFSVNRTGLEAPLLLVDDVVTTGATARACARVLRAAGAREVHVCAVARAPAPSAIRRSRAVSTRAGNGPTGRT